MQNVWRTIPNPAETSAQNPNCLAMSSDHKLSDAEQTLRDAAFEYHRLPTRGKISVSPT
jgi:hypothetical protein